jgi:hypothetical protein
MRKSWSRFPPTTFQKSAGFVVPWANGIRGLWHPFVYKHIVSKQQRKLTAQGSVPGRKNPATRSEQ